MQRQTWNRRRFLGTAAAAVAAGASTRHAEAADPPAARDTLAVDPAPRFDLSPYLYMQFMEPLGVTDSSVDAAWDFMGGRWRSDVIDITKVLAPPLIRWGGCFCSYYRWREGVGPREKRPPMLNLLWGGIYNNQVGTVEFADFCREVGAEALIVVNFQSDGRKGWAVLPSGEVRSGDAAEAAAWVDYCNNPDNAERKLHGRAQPLGIKLWQIGNETSYGSDSFTCESAARTTVEFARAMRKADPGIALIGWGEDDWAPGMCEIAGEHLDYIAFHNGLGDGGEGSPLHGIQYRKDPDRTWDYLFRARHAQAARIKDMRERVAPYGKPLAMTECHFILAGRNRNEVLSTWAAGAAYAAVMHVHERNGDVLKISTLADFCGTRWQNNAVMIPVPGGRSFLMPVAMMMSLYRRHTGTKNIAVTRAPDGLDVAASRTGDKVFLHVVNTRRTRSVTARFAVAGMAVAGGRAAWFAPDPECEIFDYRPEHTFPQELDLAPGQAWVFPPASVSAIELDVTPA
ncbi:MAG TPA: alpha-L-arabinofuranosidase [Planctomycetes bacterium]|nr:alpha-L-arabinofuranosidase [Planctomycetota bacterium]